jgi:hypothetical protein
MSRPKWGEEGFDWRQEWVFDDKFVGYLPDAEGYMEEKGVLAMEHTDAGPALVAIAYERSTRPSDVLEGFRRYVIGLQQWKDDLQAEREPKMAAYRRRSRR